MVQKQSSFSILFFLKGHLMPDEMPAFRPERQRKIIFRSKEITTADLKDGNGYVSVRSLCDAFGLDPRAQRKRLARQQGYFQPYTTTILLDTAGGPQATLCLMASGKKLSEMAEVMSLSPKTVSVYRARLLEKMKLKTNAEAIHYAITHHLID